MWITVLVTILDQFNGKVRIFKNISGLWTQIGSNLNGQRIDNEFGRSVSLSGNGRILSAGVPNFYGTGYVKVYDLDTLLQIDEQRLFNFKRYPNPTSSFLIISLNGSSELKKARIYNNLGQLISEENETQISVSNYSKGLYFAEIDTTQGKNQEICGGVN